MDALSLQRSICPVEGQDDASPANALSSIGWETVLAPSSIPFKIREAAFYGESPPSVTTAITE